MRTAFNSARSRTPSPSRYHHASSPVRTESPSSSTSTPRRFTFSLNNIENAKLIITKWDLNSSNLYDTDSLFYGNRKEARAFLRSVNDLQSMMHFLASEASKSELLIQAQTLIQIAMKRLEKEFYQILSRNRTVLDPESVSNRLSSRMSVVSSLSDELENGNENEKSTSDDEEEHVTETEEEMTTSTSTTENATSDLRSIANCMTSTGYTKECVKIYKIVRKSIVDETLYQLGVEKMNLSQVQKMDWDAIELQIKSWLKAVKYSVKTLFNGERILSDNVFSSPPRIAESCFADNCRDGALTLFLFPEHIAKYKKLSPEKIFRLLDMYDSIFDLWPEINAIFSQESLSAVKSQCESSLDRLREAIRSMLAEFESAVQKDATKSPVASGGVHPLTSYVMNYLVFLSDYSGSLTEIVSDWQQSAQSPMMPTTYISSLSPAADQVSSVSLRLGWIILVLFCKLDSKAELYKDVALSYLYLANNINYVVSKVKSTYLKLILGDVWIWKHEEKVKQYVGNYERIGWGKVFSSMEELKISPPPAGSFRKFNVAFEETYRKQVDWVVPDSKLRDAVKQSLARKLLPAYRELYNKERDGGEGNVRYAPVDLGNYLSDLFFGTGVTGSTSSSSAATR